MTQLFTDTSANLPVEIIDEYGIEVVPFSYTIDGVEYILSGNLTARLSMPQCVPGAR